MAAPLALTAGVAALTLVKTALEAVKGALELVDKGFKAYSTVRQEYHVANEVQSTLTPLAIKLDGLQGHRLNSNAADAAVAELQSAIPVWQGYLTAYLTKPITRGRTFRKSFWRFWGKEAKLSKQVSVYKSALTKCKAILDEAQVQMPLTDIRSVPSPYVEPYAFDGLKTLLASSSCSVPTKPPMANIVLLRGERGSGKSMLAMKLAFDLEQAKLPDGKVLFNGGVYMFEAPNRQASVPVATTTLQKSLLSKLRWPKEGTDPKVLLGEMDTVITENLTGRRHFIVVDDAWDKELVAKLGPDHMHGVLLATSGHSLWKHARSWDATAVPTGWPAAKEDDQHPSVLEIYLQPREALKDAKKLLSRLVNMESLTEAQQETLDTIAARCGGNLEATAIMGNFLLDTHGTQEEWEHALKRLPENVGEVLDASITISLAALDNAPHAVLRQAAVVFRLLQHVRAELPLSVPLVGLVVKVLGPGTVDEVEAAAMLDRLVFRSLVCKAKGQEVYFVTPAVDNFLATKAKDSSAPLQPSKAADQAEIDRLAALLLVFGRQHAADWARQHLKLPASPGSAATPWLPTWLDADLLEASAAISSRGGVLSWRIGRLLAQAGDFAGARQLYLQALELQPADQAHLAVDRARTVQSLAALLTAEGISASGADAAATDALNNLRQLTLDNMEIARACNNAGAAKIAVGKFVEAETLFKEALNAYQGAYGLKAWNSIQVLNNIGFALMKQAKLKDADVQLQDALKLATEDFRGTRLHGSIIDTIGQLQEAQGKDAEAVKSYERSLRIKRRALSPADKSFKETEERLQRLHAKMRPAPAAPPAAPV